jgi:hypothetical protein
MQPEAVVDVRNATYDNTTTQYAGHLFIFWMNIAPIDDIYDDGFHYIDLEFEASVPGGSNDFNDRRRNIRIPDNVPFTVPVYVFSNSRIADPTSGPVIPDELEVDYNQGSYPEFFEPNVSIQELWIVEFHFNF